MDGLEGKVDDVADAEGDDEGACSGDVGERPETEERKVEEEAADGETEEILDKGAWVFVETFDHHVVLQSCNHRKIKRQEG